MFSSTGETLEISKPVFDRQEPKLRGDLVDTQFDLIESGDFSVIVILSGMDIPGRNAAAKQLLSWMDPRHIRPFAMFRPSEEERNRPRMWRFWRGLPSNGRIGVFLNSWYEGPTRDQFIGKIDDKTYQKRIDEISRFERMLANEKTLILKFLFHVPKQATLDYLEQQKKNPIVAWKVSDEEIQIGKQIAKKYKKATAVIEQLVKETDKPYAPWTPIASSDARYRDMTIGRTIVQSVRNRLNKPASANKPAGGAKLKKTSSPNVLTTLDLSKSLERDDYKDQLKREQRKLTQLTTGKKFEKRALVCVFEGNDAAGKGGGIRRVMQGLDPRMTRIISVAAPSDEEREQPYLWRFWRYVPPLGDITIFDRSWYGRVLVERVEKFCSQSDWMRAYEEIREFEAEMMDYGIIILKFWLAIDKDEQLRRFKEREQIGYKRHKITEEDWRNRKKWNTYAQAVHDMVERTSTKKAPWTLVEANSKYYSRVKILKTINDRLKKEL